ncbi:MAG: CCA tRNA nucleotidyltransferase [Clostridia bacterium]|nr:CCA tRNA nucleotidyltransferase [Clostridia bacterium]
MAYSSFNGVILPSSAKKILSALKEKGFAAYIVGGAVRDSLIGKPVFDYDITTSARPEEIVGIFSDDKIIPTGLKHGTVTVVKEGKAYEITTFRKEKGYSDLRRPDAVEFVSSVEDDLRRRDFTVNALAYNEEEGIIDLYGGLSDLKNKIIRTVGDPDERFSEDALRILRALRFSSQLGFSIEKETAERLIAARGELRFISAERIFSEIEKLLSGDFSEEVLISFAPVVFTIIPELEKCYKFDQKSSWHRYDVYTHIVKATSAVDNKPSLKFAALLHDVAKPEKFFMKNGEGHFYGHAERSAEIANDVLKRLKAPNRLINEVFTLIKYHDMPVSDDDFTIKKRLRKFGEEIFFDLISLKLADGAAQGTRKANGEREKTLNVKKRAEEIVERGDCYSLSTLKIDGDDLVAMGYEGKTVGKMLENILDDVICGNIINDREVLLKSAEKRLI